MDTISVLDALDMESGLRQPNPAREGRAPVSLLAFLQAENLRLRTKVAELQQDMTDLRQALQHS